MTDHTGQYPIRHEPDARRFVVVVDGHECELVYRLAGGVMKIVHTGVPSAVGGRGIAGELVRAAYDAARAQGWKVIPACSYAAVWVERHPEYADLAG
ncbi:GNAT family N-acetyltransferase [Tahibacter soli]|uniref:GNAT family N-acetyltransferase n=1 Tax=Tahibacter soli TaxID=2983605 RepID=A0A9X3YL62_9GAMM|nr:GNAT family N-acetyltransferase [Tahibacter soli]MDC8013021.1 GNAT family N-acetyltransferase [Tahibacter soli]